MTPFVRKLKIGADLSPMDVDRLEAAVQDVREFRAGEDIVAEGEKPSDVHIVLSGWACRYKLLERGDRQIMAVFVPGDMCDLHVQILTEMDHAIGAVTDARIATVPPAVINDLTDHPTINLALNWSTLVDEGVLREWLLNLGQRPAEQRLAHLLCELLVRLQNVGEAEADSLLLPLTQAQLADITGMTAVHVNRSLASLRDAGLIAWNGRRLRIRDVDALKAFAGFEPAYLHLAGTRRDARV